MKQPPKNVYVIISDRGPEYVAAKRSVAARESRSAFRTTEIVKYVRVDSKAKKP
jgi:hypothetical protein